MTTLLANDPTGCSGLGDEEADSGLLQLADRSVLFLCSPGPDLPDVFERLLAEDTLVVPARTVSEVESLDFVPTQVFVDDAVPGSAEWVARWTRVDEGRVAIGMSTAGSNSAALLDAGVLLVLSRPLQPASVVGALDRARRWRSQVRALMELRARERSNVAAPVVESILSAMGHEIRNPLAVALANVEYLRDADSRAVPRLSFEERRSVIEDTYLALRRIRELWETVSTLVRGAPPASEPVPLLELAQHVAGLAPVGRTRVSVAGDAGVIAMASRNVVEQVLGGLIQEAVAATRTVAAPEIALRIYRTASEARITVRDNGPALSLTERHEVFEPKLTTGGSGASGLGLPLLRHAVTRMGGTLTLGGDQGEGRSFRLRLPLAPVSAAPSPP